MKSKLKIGILINGNMIPAWSYKMIEQINDSYYAEISLLVKNGGLNVKKSFFKKIVYFFFTNFNILLYRVYNNLDKFFYKRKPDAFEYKDSFDILNNVKIIEVIPKKTKFRDIINKDDIKKLRDENIDIFIRMGFRILDGEILNVAKYGIWSYHHGDNSVNRGSPPGFWEVFLDWKVSGVTLQILSDDLDNGQILYKSFSQTKLKSVGLTKNIFYWKALSFMPNKIKELYEIGEINFFKKINQLNNDPNFYSNPLFRTKNIGNIKILGLIFRLGFNVIKSRIFDIFFLNQWILLFKFDQNDSISRSFFRFKKILPPFDRFWADPFVIERNNNYYIFFEEYMYNTNKGHISLIVMDSKGNYSNPTRILEKDYHLSYPFIFKDGKDLYMIPETKENKTIDLYKCIEFPNIWEFSSTLINDIEAVDTTVLYKDEKYWIFANIAINKGASNLDELYIFSSKILNSGKWTHHPNNPVISDVRYARPAGKFFTYNNNLYRPSQNSSKTYGYGMNINKVLELNELNYSEETVSKIFPNWDPNISATHTINSDGKLTVIDGKYKRRRSFYQIIKHLLKF
jgi:hypothetical protein